MDTDPLELISTPKPSRKLPDVLTVDDIEKIISSVDMSKMSVKTELFLGCYSCGLKLATYKSSNVSLRHDNSLVSVIGRIKNV